MKDLGVEILTEFEPDDPHDEFVRALNEVRAERMRISTEQALEKLKAAWGYLLDVLGEEMTNFWIGLCVGWAVGGIGWLIIFILMQVNHWGDE